MQLDKIALAWAAAIFGGAGAFLIMAFSLLTGRVSFVMSRVAALHWASYSWTGALVMAIEHVIFGFILGWVFAWLYNLFIKE